jgi:hypothetical protein
MPFIVALFFLYTFFLVYSFSKSFSLRCPSAGYQEAGGGVDSLLSWEMRAVVSDFVYLFPFCYPVPQRGDGGYRRPCSSSEEEGAVPSAMLHYTFAILHLRTPEIGNVPLNSPFQGSRVLGRTEFLPLVLLDLQWSIFLLSPLLWGCATCVHVCVCVYPV